ncbi:hypothetical protein RG47T_1551 [Mucilaginibacter polytrichastri]|uniref:Uncharacterized protein n=1 Tax=Mucilaginibacter polytrichastri TaxID=1302689 RepID=A0A1Q5ZWE8_9SPHI|nr:hypothetical protein RG47T_1551 [Mucilaginibacter polytrichastri]
MIVSKNEAMGEAKPRTSTGLFLCLKVFFINKDFRKYPSQIDS